MKWFIYLTFIFLFLGCAQNNAEKAATAIDIALTHLSKDECDDALDVLEEAGNQSGNAVFLQVLASAYACKAGFNEIEFLINDLTTVDATTNQSLMTSIANMSLSPESSSDSDEYVAVRNGINTLLNSTSSKTHAAREAKFGARKAGDMGVQILLLSIVNLGKFLTNYGNTNASGLKGAGSGTNTCFMNYGTPAMQLINNESSGSCSTDTGGHPDLDRTTDEGKRRLCEGLVLITNMVDIMESLDLSSMPEIGDLENVTSTLKTELTNQGLGALITTTSQSACLDLDFDDIEIFYAAMFDLGLL